MAANDPAERSELARLAALSRWATEPDRAAATQAARDALRARFDPGPDMPEPQRSAMIRAGVEAHMLRMRRARRKRDQARLDELAAELAAMPDGETAS
jgi:hypothetical protein